MSRLGRRATFEERLKICRMIESGESLEEVVARSGFGRSTVFGWWQVYRRSGAEALRTKRTPGPRANLGTPQLHRLRSLVVEDLTKGAPEGPVLRTRKSVRRLIEGEFGVNLSPVSVGRVLDRIGMPLVSPLTRIQEAESEGTWPTGTLSTVQAVAREGATVQYVWIESLRPFQPAHHVRYQDDRPGLLIFSIGENREVCFRAVVGSTGADAFVHLCQTLAERKDRPCVVVAESSEATCSGKVTRYFAATGGQLSLLLLPARRGRQTDQANFEEAMAGGLECGSRGSSLVAFNDDRELDIVELELALRSMHRGHAGRGAPGGRRRTA